MISVLVKHLEHKAILEQPEMQLSIVEVIAALAEQSRAQASAATMVAISDLVRHMKKTLHLALGSKDLEVVKWNDKLRKAFDECIIQLSKKVNFPPFETLPVICTFLKATSDMYLLLFAFSSLANLMPVYNPSYFLVWFA
jgi:hypothetical protein